MCTCRPIETAVEGSIFPAGCYSGSCARPASQNLEVYVQHDPGKLEFQFNFVIEDYSSYSNNYGCTEDCGAGLIFFSIDELTDKAYKVWVGERLVEEIQLPSEPRCYELEENN